MTTAKVQDKSEFKEFSPKDGRFKILMPGTPKENKVDIGGGSTQTQFVSSDGNHVYLVAYHDDPNFANADDAWIKRIFASARDAGVKVSKGKLISETQIKLGTYPGLEYQSETPTGISRTRFYMVKERLYQLKILGLKAVATSKDADRFFDSFQLIDEK